MIFIKSINIPFYSYFELVKTLDWPCVKTPQHLQCVKTLLAWLEDVYVDSTLIPLIHPPLVPMLDLWGFTWVRSDRPYFCSASLRPFVRAMFVSIYYMLLFYFFIFSLPVHIHFIMLRGPEDEKAFSTTCGDREQLRGDRKCTTVIYG